MELKALEILKDIEETINNLGLGEITTNYDQQYYKAIKEAMREIEELENRNCENCKYYNNIQVCDIFIARNGNKSNDFCCNKWELK